MPGKINYGFTAEMWKHESAGSWYFVSLPKTISKEIRQHFQWQEEGWGRMKASAAIGDLVWETAIWFDTKRNTYILPIKAEIRKRCGLVINQKFRIDIWI